VSPGRADGPLEGYRKRRDFQQTAEPPGGDVGAGGPSALTRFVIHEHSARRLHWDLRLERDGVLVSWALPRGVPLEPKLNLIAPHTEDHPLEYLDFEGEIPAGNYGAGTISIWDQGTYECLKWEARKVEVMLHGERLNGRYALFAISDEVPAKAWMIHRMDPATDAAAEPMPESIAPMLARAGSTPTNDAEWAYEVKWDGVRAIAYSEPGRLRIEGRSLNTITDRYPELAALNRALRSRRAILDGEIVVFDPDGRPDFGALQKRMHVESPAAVKRLSRASPVTYVIFDLLWLDGHSLMARPYDERRSALRELALDGERWQTPANLIGRGADVLAASKAAGLEGVVAKRLRSSYRPGRRDGGWLKLKNVAREEFVVGGWTPGAGRRAEQIGALLLGVHEEPGGELRYVGRVGSGFAQPDLDLLIAKLMPLKRAASPFRGAGAPRLRAAVYVEPSLVVDVTFSEWTAGGILRSASYKGIRDDKSPDSVVVAAATDPAAPDSDLQWLPGRARGRVMARVGDHELSLSNLDKILYPAADFSKRDVIDYYTRVASAILPHLGGRPLTVKRYPDGVEGKAFFEKQSPGHRPDWVRTEAVPSERRAQIEYTVVDDLATLVWLANLAALELHVPLGRAPQLDRPTAVVFDLDPGAPATIIECCRVALWLEGTFNQLGLESFVKTSGSKGLQVYVPVGGEVSYAQTKRFARQLAQLVEQAEPDVVVSRMTRALRPGKVLIDWSQNDPHKTTVCVYSLRAGRQPTCSTPLHWDEVRATLVSGDAESLSLRTADVLDRLTQEGDLFAPMLSLPQLLPTI
jgi:bifunctional non-homologous end joining protein LigD